MWKGRDMAVCALAFLAGDFFSSWLTLPPESYLVAALFSAAAAAVRRSRITLLLTLFLLGATATQVGRMPPTPAETALKQRCNALKDKTSDYLGTILGDGDELAVLKALAIGDRSELPYRLKADYRRSGAMHLLALSGLHVGIIYKLLGYLLFFLGGTPWLRRLRSIVIVLLLWLFAMVSGMSPSIGRAVLMITLYELSPLFGARRDGLTALAVAAILITLFNPEAPRMIGFQLSFMACLAIFTVFPSMRGLLKTECRLLAYVWDCLSLAISCQLFTGPLSYFYFGCFPRYFMVTNLLTVPLVGMAVYLIAASVLTSGIPLIGPLTAEALETSVHMLNYIVSSIASL